MFFPSNIHMHTCTHLLTKHTHTHTHAHTHTPHKNTRKFLEVGIIGICICLISEPWDKKTPTPWKESNDKPRQHIRKQKHHFANKCPYRQSYGFSSSHVRMWELDHKESQAPKNWWFWTVVLEKTLERPLNCREIQPINLKGNQSWIFIRRTDTEAEAPILWPPDVKNWFIGKDPDVEKNWK